MRTSCSILFFTKARTEPFTNLPSRTSSTWKVHANGKAKPKGFSANTKDTVRVEQREGEWKKRDDEEEEPLPEEVFNRIIVRVLVSVGAPLGTGLALMKGYEVANTQAGLELPLWVQFSAFMLTFGASAIGMAYGALSSSWNPDDEGSLLGLEQLQNNWAEMWSEEKKKKEEAS